jgi:hypothetical protein
MRLKNAGSIDHAIRVLGELEARLGNFRGFSDPDHYLAWCTEVGRQLREQFNSVDLADEADRECRDLTFGGTSLLRPREFLDGKIDVWQARLNEAIIQLKALKPFIDRPGHIVVLDTSAFIEGEFFTEFGWRSLDGVPAEGPVRLVVPITVVDELDDLKRDRNPRASGRARSVLRELRELHGPAPLAAAELKGRPGVTMEVFLDDSWHERRPDTDAEIIDRAV